MSKLLSIIVPIYNVEPYLSRCLDSLSRQTYKNIEIILVDDGSTDNSAKIAKKYCELDNRFKYFYKDNGGLSDARNFGLKKANGSLIAFVDSDDFVDDDIYEKLIENMSLCNSDIAICNYYIFDDQKDLVTKTNNYNSINRNILPKQDAINLLCSDYIQSHVRDKLYRRETLNNILFPNKTNYEDVYVMHKIFLNSSTISFLNEPKYYYVQREESICKTVTIKNAYDYVNGFIKRFFDLENIVDYNTKKILFNKILSVYFYECQFSKIENGLIELKKQIKLMNKKYKLFKGLSNLNKIKWCLNAIGIKLSVQYKFFNIFIKKKM